MRYFSGHAIPGVEWADDTEYRRKIRLPGGTSAQLEIVLQGHDGIVTSCDGDELSDQLIHVVRKLFDLDADSSIIDAHLAADPALAGPVGANPGIRLPGTVNAHEQLFRTMIGQQISIAAARTILGRIASTLGTNGLFPEARHIAEHGLEVLRGPATRIAAVHGVALALESGALTLTADMDHDDLTTRLLEMPGIGPWTAGYVAMRVLGSPDVLLSTDLVLLKGAAKLGLPTAPRLLADYARRWSPYRSYASLHLWRVAQQT